MKSKPPLLAPTLLLVKYLAIFQRMFVAIDGYARADDKLGMVMGGYLANALHNVPAMLWNCAADSWYTPERIEELLDGFPEGMQERGAPEYLVADARRILAPEGVAEELGLQPDLTDLDLPPLPKMSEYLERLSWSCISLRFMRKHARGRFLERQELEAVWTEHDQTQARMSGEIAAELKPIPAALVCWARFDEETFSRAEADEAISYRIVDEIASPSENMA